MKANVHIVALLQEQIRIRGIDDANHFLRAIKIAATELMAQQRKTSRRELKKISVFDLDGRFVQSFKSQVVCAIELGVTRQAINNSMSRNNILLGKYRLKKGVVDEVEVKPLNPDSDYPGMVKSFVTYPLSK